ncbi:MAG: U32 family peptidase [Thermodesulfobacteriota bacterium]
MNKRSYELLAPAGSLEKLKCAIHYGADAVYLAGKRFGLRAKAGNFSEAELREAVAFAHGRGVRVFVTVNIMAHNDDLTELPDYLLFLGTSGVDALIIADPGVFRLARRLLPQMSIHISTQANITNYESACFWAEQGASRVNLARELSGAEIAQVCGQLPAKVEVFVHGALCISYSGRCMLSHYLTGRDANLGACAHPCRYSYRLEEEKRPGEFLPVEEDERGTYIFNAKDLCLLNRLPDLLAAGVHSLKIEGRMKGIYYAGGIVRIYRAALDFLAEAWEKGAKLPRLGEAYMAEVEKLGSRGYTENFFDGPAQADSMLPSGPRVTQEYVPVALLAADSSGQEAEIDLRHVIRPGDELEYMGPGILNHPFTVLELRNEMGVALEQANPGQQVTLVADRPLAWQEHALIRRVRPGRPLPPS